MRNDQEGRRLGALDCRIVFGDVIISGEKDETGAVLSRVDPRWIGALRDVAQIHGSLVVSTGRVDDGGTGFRGAAGALNLKYVAGDLVISDLLGVESIGLVGKIGRVGGGLGIERMPSLRSLGTLFGGQRFGSVAIVDNPRLTHVLNITPGQFEARSRIDGAFTFVGNNSFDPCLLPQVLSWALARAKQALVSGERPDFPCR